MSEKEPPDYDALAGILERHVRESIIGPHSVPAGSKLSSAIDAIATMSVLAGLPGRTPEELLQALAENLELIQDALDYAFFADSEQVNPAILFSVLDSAKSLILRNRLVRRRVSHLDSSNEAFLLTGTKHFFAKSYFESVGNPGIAICNLYMSRRGEAGAIIAFDAASPDIGYIKLRLSAQDSASGLKSALVQYCESLNSHSPDFSLLSDILGTFAPPLAHALARANFPKYLVFIPHGLLHVVPFHALHVDLLERQTGKHQQRIYLHDIAQSISYASSMLELSYSGQIRAEERTRGMRPPGFLAVLDTNAPDLEYVGFERGHYEAIRALDPTVDVVTKFGDLPSDMRH